MAVPHITMNEQLQLPRLIRRALTQLEEGTAALSDALDALDQMKDAGVLGAYATTRLGTADDTKTQGLYDELSSLEFKLTTNGAVTDVAAALAQAFAKLR